MITHRKKTVAASPTVPTISVITATLLTRVASWMLISLIPKAATMSTTAMNSSSRGFSTFQPKTVASSGEAAR